MPKIRLPEKKELLNVKQRKKKKRKEKLYLADV